MTASVARAPLFAPAVPAALALADGTVFAGRSIGAAGHATGEVVFNTAMTGYQEILTDPSYAGQIVTLTYPHIGNVGVNPEDAESARPSAKGLVIRDLSRVVSNFRATGDLVDLARRQRHRRHRRPRHPPADAGAPRAGRAERLHRRRRRARRRRDRRRRPPRRRGAEHGGAGPRPRRHLPRAVPLDGRRLGSRRGPRRAAVPRFHVIAYDFGVKHNILRMLAARGCRLTVVPATTPAAAVQALAPDGVFLSNGPGDPEPCDYAIEAIRTLVDAGVPTFGICLGHQLLGLASGARTVKMKFGHHGANHPVLDKDTGQVHITSQNHGFAVDPASLPANVRVTHVSLFDGSLQGIARTDRPAFGFQGHPEASPGPHDVAYLFDRFVKLMEQK